MFAEPIGLGLSRELHRSVDMYVLVNTGICLSRSHDLTSTVCMSSGSCFMYLVYGVMQPSTHRGN